MAYRRSCIVLSTKGSAAVANGFRSRHQSSEREQRHSAGLLGRHAGAHVVGDVGGEVCVDFVREAAIGAPVCKRP
jgi:hypothetical protein